MPPRATLPDQPRRSSSAASIVCPPSMNTMPQRCSHTSETCAERPTSRWAERPTKRFGGLRAACGCHAFLRGISRQLSPGDQGAIAFNGMHQQTFSNAGSGAIRFMDGVSLCPQTYFIVGMTKL